MDMPTGKKPEEKIDLYSFDIFDTLVTRKVALPEGVFAVMQEKLQNCENIDENLKSEFCKIRTDSEFFAREDSFASNGHKEINLERIYDKIQNRYKIESDTVEFLKQLEIETEKENLLPIESTIYQLKTLVEQEKRVVLISDMYFSENQLREILTNIDSVFSDIKIYVSSEHKCSKYDGKLYSIVSEKENVSFKKWKHIGDNRISDYENSKKLGISAKLFYFPQLKPYEKALLETERYNADIQYVIGSSKIVRFNKNHKLQGKYEFGASFAGVFLYNYVNYILEKSIEKGFKTLYFIARDGYLPKMIADIIIKNIGLELQTKYLYGSRLAWRIPTEKNYEAFVSDIFKEYPQKVSVSYLASRLHVESEILAEKFEIKNIEKIIPVEKHRDLEEKLCEHSIKRYIISENIERKDLLVKYLKQEIKFNRNEIVFVDATGSGKSQDIITEILGEDEEVKTYGFYMATSGVDNTVPNSVKDVFFTEQKPHYHYTELLCRTNAPQTIGYEEIDGEIVPVFEEVPKNLMNDWGYEDYLEGICDFTENITKTRRCKSDLEIFRTYTDFITTKCDRDTANILGEIPVSTIGKEGSLKIAAPKIDWSMFLYMMLLRKKPEDITEFPYLMLARSKGKLSDFISDIQKTNTFWLYIKLYFMLKRNKRKRIILWGASLFLEDFVKKFNPKFDNVLGIVDKNPNRQGKSIGDYRIYSLEEVEKLNPDAVILTIKNKNEVIYADIKKYLANNNSKVKLLSNIFS